MIRSLKLSILACLVVVAAFALPKSGMAQAGDPYFYVSPASGTFNPGDTFKVTALVASPDQSINAVGSVLVYPPDLLEVANISNSGSVVGVWLRNPESSATSGRISFEGIIVNPGYQGNGGKLFEVTFKAKAGGLAAVGFDDGKILANNGEGTNVIGSSRGGQYTLTTEPIISAAPPKPVIVSPNHPNQSGWSNKSSATFQWTIPTGVTGESFVFNSTAGTIPPEKSSGLDTSKDFGDLKEGVYYFHLRFENSLGWGPTTHYKIQIDLTPPETPKIDLPDAPETENPMPTINFTSKDALSGIEGYEILLHGPDGEQKIISTDNSKVLPKLKPGKYAITVIATDKAGNTASADAAISIKQIVAPSITDYPRSILPGETLVFKGLCLPRSQVIFTLTRDDGFQDQHDLRSGDESSYVAVWPRLLDVGNYTVSAKQINQLGAESGPSESVHFEVARPVILFQIGSIRFDATSLIISMSLFALLLFTLIIYEYVFAFLRRKKLVKMLTESYHTIHREFLKLRQEADSIPVSQLGPMEMIKEDLASTEDKIEAEIANVTKRARR